MAVIPQPPVAGTVQGAMATDGTLALSADQKKIDMFPRIFQYDPTVNPILTIVTNRVRSQPATEVETKWLEDSPIPSWLTASAGIASGVTTLVLSAGQGAYVLPNAHVLKNMTTGELIQVTAVSTDTLTIVRGYAGTTAAAIATTDYLLNLRGAFGQGTNSPVALSTTKATKSNFCQIRKTTASVTKTLDAVALYGGDERLYQRMKAAQEHARDWEHILLHGTKGSVVSGQANPVFLTGGLDYYITTNVLATSGTLTESEFLDFLPNAFRYSVSGSPGKSKVLFASSELINTINAWGISKLQTTTASDKASQTYGIDIREYVSGFGRLSVVYHPLLEQGARGRGYIIDLDGVMMRPLRATKLNTNVQAPDADVYKDEYLTEAGFMVASELSHGLITGVTY